MSPRKVNCWQKVWGGLILTYTNWIYLTWGWSVLISLILALAAVFMSLGSDWQVSHRAGLLSRDRAGLLSYDRAGLPILVHFVAGTGRVRSVDRRSPLLLLLVTKNTGVGQVLLLNLTSQTYTQFPHCGDISDVRLNCAT